MRILAYEAVTGGAMIREEPSSALVHEADLMIRALLADLAQCDGILPVTTRDHRLPPITGHETFVVERLQDPMIAFDLALATADAAWIIAPETGGDLERLARHVVARGRTLIGPDPDAIAIATSKRATAEALASGGVPVVPTFTSADEIPPLPGLWVVKPDDGAGAEATVRCWNYERATERLRPGMVAQPWIDGDSLSLSLLCHRGASRLLSINRQHIRLDDDTVRLGGITVNAMTDTDDVYAELGNAVARAMPGLSGWVGVDLVAADGALTVLEVNPRLTTSYVGLRPAKALNGAALVLELLRTGTLPPPDAIPVGTPMHLDLRQPNAE